VEADSVTLLGRDLPERRIELAMVPLLTDTVSEDLTATILFQDHLRLVVGANNRWAHRRHIKLAELIDEPWCVAPSSVGSLIAEAFRASGLEMPRIALTTTTAHLLFQLLESGRFVGHFGDGLLHFYANRFALKRLPIELPIPPFLVAIVTVKNRTVSPVAELFIDCAREIARPLAKRQSRSAGNSPGRKGKASGSERA
jgi:DNA-binding transcriptional LysR family regulator